MCRHWRHNHRARRMRGGVYHLPARDALRKGSGGCLQPSLFVIIFMMKGGLECEQNLHSHSCGQPCNIIGTAIVAINVSPAMIRVARLIHFSSFTYPAANNRCFFCSWACTHIREPFCLSVPSMFPSLRSWKWDHWNPCS